MIKYGLGILLWIVGLSLFIFGVLGAIGCNIYMIALFIFDIIKMVNGNVPITVWSIFYTVIILVVREFCGAMVMILCWGLGLLSITAAGELVK